MLRWQSRRAFAEAFAPVARQGIRLCRVPRLAVAAPRRSFPTKSIAAIQPSLSAPQQDRAPVLRPKDARRIATRDEKCANNFLSAVCLVALISFWRPGYSCGSYPAPCKRRRSSTGCHKRRRGLRRGSRAIGPHHPRIVPRDHSRGVDLLAGDTWTRAAAQPMKGYCKPWRKPCTVRFMLF
jgi:hypothetical protein